MREVVHRYLKAKQPLCIPKVDPYKVVVSLCGGWGALSHVRSQSYSPHLQPSICNLASRSQSKFTSLPYFSLPLFIVATYLLSLIDDDDEDDQGRRHRHLIVAVHIRDELPRADAGRQQGPQQGSINGRGKAFRADAKRLPCQFISRQRAAWMG